MNNCTFVGRIGQDLELKTAGATTVVNFSVAVRRQFIKDGQPDSDWLNFVAFGKTSEFITKYFQKGSEIAIVAHAQVDSFEKDGQKRTVTKFMVDSVSFTGGSKAEGGSPKPQGQAPKSQGNDFVSVDDEFSDSDVPF